ncbi:MAG: hypothetical protein JJU03_01520 [Idiomarina sp.]|nr:hypothetical protein [Idiomarina sp.]
MRRYLICHLMLAVLLLPFSGGAHACEDQAEFSQLELMTEADEALVQQALFADDSHDCCEPANACAASCCDQQCPPGCGHCIAHSHGCSIPALNTLMVPMIATAELVAFMASRYDHIGPTPTPPPDIPDF